MVQMLCTCYAYIVHGAHTVKMLRTRCAHCTHSAHPVHGANTVHMLCTHSAHAVHSEHAMHMLYMVHMLCMVQMLCTCCAHTLHITHMLCTVQMLCTRYAHAVHGANAVHTPCVWSSSVPVQVFPVSGIFPSPARGSQARCLMNAARTTETGRHSPTPIICAFENTVNEPSAV